MHNDDPTVHPLARCCWCGAAFVRATVKGLPVWLCSTEACWKRQVKHAMVATVGKRTVCRFVPLPRQVDTIEAVEDPAGPTYILMGGAAGGSKSRAAREIAHRVCLITAGLRVLLLRRTFRELEQTHLLDVQVEAPEMGAVAVPSAKVVRYPNGSLLQFGHCETSADAANYLSSEYDLIIFDELVTFEELQFLLISSRARSTKAGVVPKVLAGTNPGGPQSAWVRARFVDKVVDLEMYPDYRAEDYCYIPSKLDDNPYLDERYERKLLALPPELRRAYREGDWDVFPGQYFPEWRRGLHVTAEAITYPRDYLRVLLMDWGYVKPGYVGWMVQLPEGGAYLEQEYVPVRVSPFEQGVEIGRRCKAAGLTRLGYLVYDTQMETPGHDTGEPIIETVRRGMRSVGVSLATKKADKDRLNGWARFRAWLRPDPTGTPWLRVSPACPYAIRTIPAQVSAAHNPEDIDSDGEDHAVDPLRYWAMSRPLPGSVGTTAKAPPAWSLKWFAARTQAPQGILDRGLRG